MESLRLALRREVHQYGDNELHPALLTVIEHYIDRPAQFFRGRLMQDAARIYATGPVSPAVERLMVGVEMLHLFALIHDDWLDREDHPHRPPAGTTGEALLLAGDAVHTMGMGLIHHTLTKYHCDHKIAEIVERTARITISGQMQELHQDTPPASREELFQLYDSKTGFYTAVAPLQTGALAVMGPGDFTAHQDLPVLEALGLIIGRAYQLRDDVSDLSQENRNLLPVMGLSRQSEPAAREECLDQWIADLRQAAEPWILRSQHPRELAELLDRSMVKVKERVL
jgi:geranylgeranyl pyrophosphate synthase